VTSFGVNSSRHDAWVSAADGWGVVAMAEASGLAHNLGWREGE
jgi:hypothetical protein